MPETPQDKPQSISAAARFARVVAAIEAAGVPTEVRANDTGTLVSVHAKQRTVFTIPRAIAVEAGLLKPEQ